jgi:hypothetical protein
MSNNLYLCKKNAMVELNIKPEDRQLILEGRYTQPHPRVMQKYDALRLKDCGLSNKLIYS